MSVVEPITTLRSDPAILQRRAASPERSVWVSASAGTGKTKVLTDRVLSLLLAGTPPHRILCLTFTRAAAAEMAIRINRALASWAIVSDDDLVKQIEVLTGSSPDEETLRRARPLFARVLEVPGGMKIQTIHSFCESLLGRFPLEAGIAPHFEVMDERDAAEGQAEARLRVLNRAREDGDAAISAALAGVIGHINEEEFGSLMAALSADRGRIRRLIESHGGVENLVDATYARLGVPQDDTPEMEKLAASQDGTFDAGGLRRAAAAMLRGSATDKSRGAVIAAWLETNIVDRAGLFDAYLGIYFTTTGTIRKSLINNAAKVIDPAAEEVLGAEAQRLDIVQQRIRAAVTAAATAALLHLADALLTEYEGYKREIGRLDYDDLILMARALLERDGGASWVLFKLDGGIDHILIDEAQDTNPDQWAVVRALAEEFFAGVGASQATRTVFAVGDTKQSIYSFQRAAPEEFDKMRAYFRARAKSAEQGWDDVNLDMSFRSTAAVLGTVDEVFARAEARDGLAGPDHQIHHEPYREGQAGLVELWPPVAPLVQEERAPWEPPVTARREDHPAARLASVIAGCIGCWIENGERLETRDRPVQPGDIMVLVRRRGTFVEELVRALKQRNVPVAGVDRMVLGEQLAVRDLLALGNFLLLPEDDLTLAVVLKGPLFGFDDDDLFALAYGRKDQTLWHRLRTQADRSAKFRVALDELSGLLARVDFVAPFELFADVLARRRGRLLIGARLGRDANDPLDEFLARALGFERTHAPSLQAFLHSFDADSVEVKRDLEQAMRNEVRVMTVHGSKGLQAPIVFLPDTLQAPSQRPDLLWSDDPYLLWPPRARFVEPVSRAAIDQAVIRRDQEYRRLLYVAMTRAEDRLYVCGWHTRSKPPAGNWYDLIAGALENFGEPASFDLTEFSDLGWQGEGRRVTNPQTASPKATDTGHGYVPVTGVLPGWALQPPPPEDVPPRPLTPSRPDEDEPALRSPQGSDAGAGFRRGLLVHRLLQILPEMAPENRTRAAQRFLARRVHDLDQSQQDALAAEVLAVLGDPAFAALFGSGSRAEVPIVGRIGDYVVAGQVDRLCVTEEAVQIVDYKTNRPPPADARDVPPIYLRQMAAYRAVLWEIYPLLSIQCALLWTDGPRLMQISEELLAPWAP
ncbi:MAG: double-strand break repair helicase AddA [Proteobacteria bacterium]|nr:double-strand break repair helicase AddA [Pseudomonadota bacterium]